MNIDNNFVVNTSAKKPISQSLTSHEFRGWMDVGILQEESFEKLVFRNENVVSVDNIRVRISFAKDDFLTVNDDTI